MFCASAGGLWAGGSGLNVVVVVNQNSTNSVQLGNYYREARQVPPQNYLRINWPLANGVADWNTNDFNTYLLNPLLSLLSARQLTNQIDCVVLSMDIPYRISDASTTTPNSTSSALFYGYKPDSVPWQNCPIAPGSTNYYAGSECIFRLTPPISATSNSFLVTMITSSNLALAKQIVDGGVASDSAFPTQTVYLAKSTDVDRNVRYVLFDNAIFNTRLRGNYSMQRVDAYGLSGLGSIFGAETGAYNYGLSGVSFVPGSLADNLTSWGGLLSGDPSGQLSVLALLAIGAAGSYGTVFEPCNYLQKFPSPQNYFYQARGFSLAECYYLSVTNPYEGVLVGEPLAAPFAQPASGSWGNLPSNAWLSGTTNLSLQFNAKDPAHPVQQVDLFVDGLLAQTITNIPPGANNLLYVTINQYPTNYTVPANASIKSVVSNLTARLNAAAYVGNTKALAFAHGDRIELQSTNGAKSGLQTSLTVSNWIGTATAATTFLSASGTNFLDTVARGLHNLVVTRGTTYPPPSGNWLLLTITKTNGGVVKVGSTNNSTTLTNIALVVSNLINQVNANSLLTGADGCVAADFIDYSRYGSVGAEFNLYPRTAGWNAAQITGLLTASSSLYYSINPSGSLPLQDNVSDLEPRAQLYVTAGATNLPLVFAFNTAGQADGFHELTAVAYEGSHVRTQKRLSQTVQIHNTALAATFNTLFGGSNTLLGATLQFSVLASGGTITNIELFSTGGSLGKVSNQSSATFSVASTNLGLGLHPFYALATANTGKQYRTETKWIRLLGPEPVFAIALQAPPAALSWPATAGRSYDILTSTNLTNAFQANASLTPSNSSGQWADTNGPAPRRFYRIHTSY